MRINIRLVGRSVVALVAMTSLAEFGRLLITFAGWGMRIQFVAEERLEEEPRVEWREPAE